jgi:serine/threonine-protein kinase RsbW
VSDRGSDDVGDLSSAKAADIDHDVVDISVPARGVYVATLRLTATSLAARCDLTVDDIDDLGLAVDEACSLLLPHATPDTTLSAHFELESGCLTVATSVHAPDADAASPDREGFAWSLLSALATDVEVAGSGGMLSITVTKRRETASA